MAKVWIRAKTIVRAEKNGSMMTFHPGDWLQVGRQQARELITTGDAEILKSTVLQTVQDLTDCQILLRGVLAEPQLSLLKAQYPNLPIEPYQDHFPDGRFLLWDPTRAELRRELILVGFGLLRTWQLAVPLLDYETLADNVGSEQERQETAAVVHDLRVPVYDTNVIFVRSCRETRRLFELWQDGSLLGFLRALYQSRPVVNALPPIWVLR